MKWSNLQIFLSVHRQGSLRQAAKELGVTQPTVARQLNNLERDLGFSLFERTRSGHKLTQFGKEMLQDVEHVENAIHRVDHHACVLRDKLHNSIRIGVVPGETAAMVLMKGLAQRKGGPKIELVDISTRAHVDRRQPDFMVRHHIPKEGGGLTRRVGTIDCAIFGDEKFIGDRMPPLSPSELNHLPYISYLEEQSGYVTSRWLNKWAKGRPPTERMMNTDLIAAAVGRGMGVSVLPCFLGKTLTGAVQLSSPIVELRSEYWIINGDGISVSDQTHQIVEWVVTCFKELSA